MSSFVPETSEDLRSVFCESDACLSLRVFFYSARTEIYTSVFHPPLLTKIVVLSLES